jgi:kynurenine formamidase
MASQIRRVEAIEISKLHSHSNNGLGQELERLPVRGFSVIALPMKIKGGTGGPLRVVAIVK